MGIDVVVSLVSLFGPKLIDLVKGLVHRKDAPEATIASLAQTNPTALAEYVKAQAALIDARVRQFNQDLPAEQAPAETPVWIIALRELLEIYRGAIRPLVITVAGVHVTYVLIWGGGPAALALIPEWVRYQYEIAISSWFGDRWK
jgi:hypothetical protein